MANKRQEIDELVEEWTPEELVIAQTAFERTVSEKQPVIIGYKVFPSLNLHATNYATDQQDQNASFQMAEW